MQSIDTWIQTPSVVRYAYVNFVVAAVYVCIATLQLVRLYTSWSVAIDTKIYGIVNKQFVYMIICTRPRLRFSNYKKITSPPLWGAHSTRIKSTQMSDCGWTILIGFLSWNRLLIWNEFYLPEYSAKIQMFHNYSSAYITRRLVLNKL
jgi:hypothetical protein